MSIWCVANQKGGVGKTTTAVALASLVAAEGKRVLAIDLDPHASLSHWLGGAEGPEPRGVADLFADAAPPVSALLRDSGAAGLQVLPAQPALATVERHGVGKQGMGLVLSRALAEVAPHYDLVVLDCPPTLGVLMVSALAAADLLVAPTQTEPLALHGLAGLLRTAQMIERSRGRALPVRIVPTMYDKRTRAAQDTLATLRERYAASVWEEEIPVDTRLREASRDAQAPALAHALSRGVVAYARLLAWLRGAPLPEEKAA
ncbi:MAG: ParA family protein [Xanthomonadaceae bacterium]|jgi:chromosome partitioning protein|nr:ParA family protein [Xanthomonadaceae bacterium]